MCEQLHCSPLGVRGCSGLSKNAQLDDNGGSEAATNPNGSGHEWQLNMLAVQTTRALIDWLCPTALSTVES
jgi:hypothetical protein